MNQEFEIWRITFTNTNITNFTNWAFDKQRISPSRIGELENIFSNTNYTNYTNRPLTSKGLVVVENSPFQSVQSDAQFVVVKISPCSP